MKYPFLLILLAGFFLSHCQRGADYRATLTAEAESYHQQAEEIQRKLLPAIQHLEQERNQINIQGRALSEAEQERVAVIEALLEQYTEFEAQFKPVAAEGISRKVVAQERAKLEAIQAIQEEIKHLE